MKKNAFTLIELLAVIVILAIIALIATPIILGIIKDAKEQATLRSAEMYLKAVNNSIVQRAMDNKKIEDEAYPIIEGGNICLKYDDSDECIDVLPVEIEGEVPISGTIKITNGTVSDGTTLTIGNIPYIKENGKLVKEGEESIPEPVSFADDSWDTIEKNVKAGNLSKYKVGDKKEIKLEGYTNEEQNSKGLYTVRIANVTSDDPVCKNDNYSKTACGFVVEFEDIITTHNMNPAGKYKDVQYNDGWNVDGYPASLMYKFINEEKEDTVTSIYESLPKELKDVIINTKVVSSHGSTTGETNFISTDKLYLLSTKEVYGKEGTSNPIKYDTAEIETRQLDYYKDVAKVTTNSCLGAIKKYNGGAYEWWLRSAHYSGPNVFYIMFSNGNCGKHSAVLKYGVAPAFRIG